MAEEMRANPLRRLALGLARLALETAQWLLRVFPTFAGVALRRFVYSRFMARAGRFHIWEDVWVTGFRNISIGDETRVAENCRLHGHDGTLRIGSRCSLSANVQAGAAQGELHIGDDVSIGPNTVIRAGIHRFERLDLPINRQGHERTVIRIEDDVWIASNVVISGGVTLGKGCVVGAGSVVTRDVAPYTVVAGAPAKFIKNRG